MAKKHDDKYCTQRKTTSILQHFKGSKLCTSVKWYISKTTFRSISSTSLVGIKFTIYWKENKRMAISLS